MKSTHKARPRLSLPEGRKRTPKNRNGSGHKVVSDHALVRYMERAMGLDVEAVREAILTNDQKLMIAQLQCCSLPLGHGLYAKVRDGVVVTIV